MRNPRMEDTRYLFAYGTLLTGTRNPRVNARIRWGLEPLWRAYLQGRLHELGGYPGAVPSGHPNEQVYGRVFRMREPAVLLPALDWFEGHDPRSPKRSYFVRRAAPVFCLPDRSRLIAWIYYYNSDLTGAPRIDSGDYMAHLRGGGANAPTRC